MVLAPAAVDARGPGGEAGAAGSEPGDVLIAESAGAAVVVSARTAAIERWEVS